MRNLFYILVLFTGMILVSCVNENADSCKQSVEIALALPDFKIQTETRSARATGTEVASVEEAAIKNLYVFLFHATKPVIKYSTEDAASVGAWDKTTLKVIVNKFQTEVGTRDVYVVANYDAALKTQLDGVTTLAGLQVALKTVAELPIVSDIAGSGLLMEGRSAAPHDFTTDYQLKTISLIRAVAKLDITVTLDAAHWSALTTDYGYKYLNFGSETWAIEKSDQQTADKVLSHTEFQPIQGIALGPSGQVTTFKLTTYINEYANTAEPTPTVEFKLPYKESEGSLPPPEFGEGDMYRLKLPATVTRNTCYRYNVEI